ncbi:MAG TPA: class I SAM-dependent methyltransferase [Burkholderiales bacterium]|nr:class I SAM-dependent methyltransferase [Burkholderiales bacterium]
MTPVLHSPLRRRNFSPEVAAGRHGVASGMTVLEVGPGDGYLTVAAADRTSPGGRLICLDLQLAMLRKLRKALGVRTPPLVCASGSQLPFRANAFDLVFLSQVLGEIPDRTGALSEYARVLRPSGTLAITEGLPDPDFIRCARLVRMARGAGFRPAERFGRTFYYTQRFYLGGGAA